MKFTVTVTKTDKFNTIPQRAQDMYNKLLETYTYSNDPGLIWDLLTVYWEDDVIKCELVPCE